MLTTTSYMMLILCGHLPESQPDMGFISILILDVDICTLHSMATQVFVEWMDGFDFKSSCQFTEG